MHSGNKAYFAMGWGTRKAKRGKFDRVEMKTGFI
jgi:hypothetical protein